MTKLVGEFLFALVGNFIERTGYSLFLKAAAWLETKNQGRRINFFLGGLLGLAAYFLLPIFTSLLGF